MGPKKRPQLKGDSGLKFRPSVETKRSDAKGTRPLPDPTSVKHVLIVMFIHLCKKVLFVNISVKVGVYGVVLFLGSLIADFAPIPRTYLASKENIFNVYFVKFGWGWTLVSVGTFLSLTAYTYCCGNRREISRHLLRLAIGTGMWYFWTNTFVFIEKVTGFCSVKNEKFKGRDACLKGGFKWHGLDLSGHVFLLIYCSLLIIEEARAIVGWETIKDMIRDEDYNKANIDSDSDNIKDTPISHLSTSEYEVLKTAYERYTPIVRANFVVLTMFVILWDVMLVCTILYFHIMLEKFLSGIIAVLMWFVTYRFWYHMPFSPGRPGEGLFKYRKSPNNNNVPLKQSQISRPLSEKSPLKSRDQVPKFMGMPLYALRSQTRLAKENAETAESKDQAAASSSSIVLK